MLPNFVKTQKQPYKTRKWKNLNLKKFKMKGTVRVKKVRFFCFFDVYLIYLKDLPTESTNNFRNMFSCYSQLLVSADKLTGLIPQAENLFRVY